MPNLQGGGGHVACATPQHSHYSALLQRGKQAGADRQPGLTLTLTMTLADRTAVKPTGA